MQIYKIREGKFYVPFLLESICLVLLILSYVLFYVLSKERLTFDFYCIELQHYLKILIYQWFYTYYAIFK